MRICISILAASLCIAATGCMSVRDALFGGDTRGVRITSPAIVLRQDCSLREREAAAELEGYLARLLNRPISRLTHSVPTPGIGHIHVGISPSGSSPDKREDAAYAIRTDGTFIYGNREPAGNDPGFNGLLATVYAFLEQECGIHWVMPGEEGVVIPDADALVLRPGTVYQVHNTPEVDVVRFPDVPEEDVRTWLIRNRAQCNRIHVVSPECTGLEITPFPAVGIGDRLSKRSRRTRKSPEKTQVAVGPGLMNAFRAYLAVRTAREPESEREHILGDFCATFGNGATDIVAYHNFWIDHAERNIAPIMAEVMKKGGLRDGYRKQYGRAPELYPQETFTQAATFLDDATLKVSSPSARKLLQRLFVDHEHAAIVTRTCAVTLSSAHNQRPEDEMLRQIRLLRDTRDTELRGYLPYAEHLSMMEDCAGDVTGLQFLSAAEGKQVVRRLPVIWYAGAKDASWENMMADDLRRDAKETLRTDRVWEDGGSKAEQGSQWIALIHDVGAGMRKKELYLGFWGITGEVDVFVNGVLAGKHSPATLGRSSSLVRIDPQLDATTDEQVFSLKITGNGPRKMGIWRPLWLVAGKNRE